MDEINSGQVDTKMLTKGNSTTYEAPAGEASPSEASPSEASPSEASPSEASPSVSGGNKNSVWIFVVGAILFIALVVLAFWFLMSNGERTEQIRDVFIIFMALESLLVGVVLIVLVAQLARLINLLQNEVKPILESTNETVSTLRGTTVFLSDHLAEPIIQLNGYLAALHKLTDLLSLSRKK